MHPRPSFRQALNRAVAERRLLVIPGAYDALSALLIERAGFDTMFIGGFPVAGARYGVPDIGLKGFADIATAVRDIIAACEVPILVDIDDGYGDVKNAVHTVQTYERMGASAVFLEDQAWPKRCGHMAGKKVVPAEVMEAKIKATMAERISSGDADLRAHRRARRARLRRGAAARRALHPRRRGGDLRRGAGKHRRARTARPQLRRAAIRQSAGRRPHPDPVDQGIRAARVQRHLLRPRNDHACRQGNEDRARGHARRHLRAARQGHELRGVQGGRALRPMGPHRQSLWSRGAPLPTGSTRRPTDAASTTG